MIKIKISKDNYINQIIIAGHSGYDVEGKDIVCAGVSSIAITSINAILRIDNEALKYEKKPGYIKIIILKHNDIIDMLIDNMLDLLKQMQEQYKCYIEI